MPIQEIRWYVERPSRDLSLCTAGDTVYIDIEPDCFEDPEEVRTEGTRLTAHRLTTGIYTNASALKPVFGESSELADWPCPLYLASWGVVPYQGFEPFNGWKQPQLWQVSDKGIAGVNADIAFDPEGRLWCDISNWTKLDGYEAYVLRQSMYGVVIGLQNAGIARYQWQLLTQ